MSRKDFPSKQHALRASTAERLEAIVEAAERAAEKVIDDAEAEARRYLAEAQAEADRQTSARLSSLSDLTDSLLGQALELRHMAERLQSALEGAKDRIEAGNRGVAWDADDDAAAGAAPRSHGVHLTAVAPIDVEETGSADPGADHDERGTPAGARLLATQMAVSGSSREEIEQRLRNGFQIEDTASILDAILGPED
jgi:hypothetical protein